MLPNNYIPMNCISWLSEQGVYWDTGIVPKNTIDIELLMTVNGTSVFGLSYLFGARNTNSNTSAGQQNIITESNGDFYIGYNNTRYQMFNVSPSPDETNSKFYYQKKGKFATVFNSFQSATIELPTTSFTGTRNMYLFARNNGGNAQTSNTGKSFYFCKLIDNTTGEILRHYIPVYDETSMKYGLYDLANDTFDVGIGTLNNPRTPHSIEVQSNGHGDAYIINEHIGNISKMLITDVTTAVLRDNVVHIKAIAEDGYVFNGWTNQNNVLVSADAEYTLNVSSDTVLTANFVKATDQVQNNGYQVMGISYGGYLNQYETPTYAFARVVSAEIVEDMLEQTTTKLILDNVPNTFINGVPLFVYSPKGELLYMGIIETVEGTEVICREILSIADMDYYFDSSYSIQNKTVLTVVLHILNGIINGFPKLNYGKINSPNYAPNSPLKLKNGEFEIYYDHYIYADPSKNYLYNFPSIIEEGVANAEDFLFEVANGTVIYFKPSITVDSSNRKMARLTPINPYAYEKLTFGTNNEEITEVEVEVEQQETTVLQIFNEAGTTLRAIYTVKNDGSVVETPALYTDVSPDYLSYHQFSLKVINSNDALPVIINQNLSNSFYNHKITMTIDLTKGTFKLSDFEIGRPIDFYVKDRLYRSMITSREYKFDNDNDQITSVNLTLGRVRNNLTSKINLGKV